MKLIERGPIPRTEACSNDSACRPPGTLNLQTYAMRTCIAGILAALSVATCANAALVDFNYSQTAASTGSGSILPFSFMGHNFTATAMPAPLVINPNPGTPAGFVGSIDAQAGNSNETNEAVGLLWSGFVTALSTDGFLIDIPLQFVPKEIQNPDINDYTWNVVFGDSPTLGVDAVSSSLRFAMWLSRDDVINGAETPDTFQRYTQANQTFTAGEDIFTNTDTSTAPLKDATDAGAPAGVDAAGRDLAFYWGWRDQGALSSGAILVDEFTVGGLLNADEATLRQVPEPSTTLLIAMGLSALAARRRRRAE